MRVTWLPAVVLVSACTVGPTFKVPQATLQQRFVGGDAAKVGAVAEERWWESYRDTTLNRFVTIGLEQNLDVMAANERIREARANLRATGVNAAVDGSLDGNQTRSGADGIDVDTSISSELSASLVIDLFGGIRRERESALASLAEAQAEVETTRLAWLAELVAAYADARYNQQALALTRETIKAREETLDITREQLNAGASTDYELAEAEAALASARADVPSYAANFNANVFAIGSLINRQSDWVYGQMQAGAPQLRVPPTSASGVPADLLRNRPDIRSAESALAASVADAGVAEAELYPSLTLSGSVARSDGLNSWSFGPILSLPILNRGALAASRDAAQSAARQAAIDWQSSVVGAVEDVQVARSDLNENRRRAEALRTAADAYGRAFDLAQQNYRAGAITLLDLLDTDRSTASARISAASGANDAAKSWATYQIAIGAGASAVETVAVNDEAR